MGRFLIEFWLLGGFFALGSIFGRVMAIASIFGRDLGFWSSYRFFGVFLALGTIFWLLGRFLAF